MTGPATPALALAHSRPALRVLHLEDSEPDHALALAHLQRSGLVVQALRIESRAEFQAALAQDWDVVLSDYHLPGFTGIDALQMVRQLQDAGTGGAPFILVSGQIGEDTAVEAMRNGAADYLLKNNLARLAPAIEHAITAAENRRARTAADHEVQVSKARLSALAQHLQTTVEAERHAIAREIHDDVGGSLTALKFELAWIRRHIAGLPALPAALPARLDSAEELVTHAIEVSQRIMQNLRPAILEQGLVAALQWLCSGFEKRHGVVCELRVAPALQLGGDQTPTFPPGVALVAYRTAQEALTNASKHAQASQVVVDVSASAGVLSLEISDNGSGLAQGALTKSKSFGIRGLHERASTVGGWVELSSSRAGTTLILGVPLDGMGCPPASPPDAQAQAEAEAWSTKH